LRSIFVGISNSIKIRFLIDILLVIHCHLIRFHRISGVMVTVLASSVVGRGFEPRLG
jgi:hypothetical protein